MERVAAAPPAPPYPSNRRASQVLRGRHTMAVVTRAKFLERLTEKAARPAA